MTNKTQQSYRMTDGKQQSKRFRDMNKKNFGNPIAKNMNKFNKPKAHKVKVDKEKKKLTKYNYEEFE